MFTSIIILTAVYLSALACATTLEGRKPKATGGYVQNASGTASFTSYKKCAIPACGRNATGYTAAMNQLSFGAPGGAGAGDACGRCFKLTADQDPYSPGFKGPFKSVVVKITDLCPVGGNEEWCGQTTSKRNNTRNMSVHFDLCADTGAAGAFFPSGHGALTGSYTEVDCKKSWRGSNGPSLWNGGCLSGDSAAFWPGSVGCGNKGTAPS